jgi:hypothetical protein
MASGDAERRSRDAHALAGPAQPPGAQPRSSLTKRPQQGPADAAQLTALGRFPRTISVTSTGLPIVVQVRTSSILSHSLQCFAVSQIEGFKVEIVQRESECAVVNFRDENRSIVIKRE